MCQKMRKMEQHLIRCIADTQTAQLQHTSRTTASHVKDKDNEQIARADLHKTCNTGFCGEISSASLNDSTSCVSSHTKIAHSPTHLLMELAAEAWTQGP